MTNKVKADHPFFDWLKLHPAMGGTFFIIFSATIGMIYEIKLYSEFNINIFIYSEIEDFFLSWLRDPIASTFVAVSFFGLIGNYIGRLYNDYVVENNDTDTSFVDALLVLDFLIFPVLPIAFLLNPSDISILKQLGIQEFVFSTYFILMIFGLGVFSGYQVKLSNKNKHMEIFLISVAVVLWIILIILVSKNAYEVVPSLIILFILAVAIQLMQFFTYYFKEKHEEIAINWQVVEEVISNRLPIILALSVIVGPFIAASNHHSEIVNRNNGGYYIQMKKKEEIINRDCQAWQIIGTSTSYIFFYDKAKDTTEILRSDDISRISRIKPEECNKKIKKQI